MFAPSEDGRALILRSDADATAREIEKFSKRDAANYLELEKGLARAGEIIAQVLALTPPEIDKPSKEDIWKLLKIGRKVRGLGKKEMMRLIRWGPMAVADFVAEFFRDGFAAGRDCCARNFGAAMGPWSAGSTTLLLLRAVPIRIRREARPFHAAEWARWTAAMAAAAKHAGAEIRTGAEVKQFW